MTCRLLFECASIMLSLIIVLILQIKIIITADDVIYYVICCCNEITLNVSFLKVTLISVRAGFWGFFGIRVTIF